MENLELNKWNDKYRGEAYAYGEEANNYLKEKLLKLAPGRILFPAEGEGRNAVFAAKQGWEVSAFDISTEGQKKALRLAEKNDVRIDYLLGDLPSLAYQSQSFDALAMIYVHLPFSLRKPYHQLLNSYLRRGGMLIFEAFSKNHLAYNAENPAVGGPKELSMLFSTDEILKDFEDYDVIELEEREVELNEGFGHRGKGSVIRFLGRKR